MEIRTDAQINEMYKRENVMNQFIVGTGHVYQTDGNLFLLCGTVLDGEETALDYCLQPIY